MQVWLSVSVADEIVPIGALKIKPNQFLGDGGCKRRHGKMERHQEALLVPVDFGVLGSLAGVTF